MSAAVPNHYDTLGLSTSATPDEIRRRYRELARRYHPDVARTPELGLRFAEINAAHSVFSDPEKRASYDALMRLKEVRAQTTSTAAAAPKPAGSANRPTTAGPPDSSQSRPDSAKRTASKRSAEQAERAVALVGEARRAMGRLRYREAEQLCRQANKLRRIAESYEILGDIYRTRGHTDDAVAMYSYALQLDRNNRGIQMKFDRLVGQPSGATMAGSAARATRPSARSRYARETTSPGIGLRVPATVVGMAVVCGLIALAHAIRNPPATSAMYTDWEPALLVALAVSGAIIGALLAGNSLLAPARSELIRSQDGSGSSAGPALVLFSLLSIYASVVLCGVIALFQGRVSASVVRSYCAALLVTGLFAVACPISSRWILLTGGNVVFPALVLGWLAGDATRR